LIGPDQIGDAPVRPGGDGGYHRVAVEAEEAHGGGQHAGTLVLGLVEYLARRRGDDGVNVRGVRRAEVIGGHHHP
jgi:hypothetical protein